MSVGISRHVVGQRRHPKADTAARVLLVALATFLHGACAGDPERLLCGRWQELDWRYERLDPPPDTASLVDLVAPTRQRDRRIVRHEAEYWEFRCDGALVISKLDGEKLRRRWWLKGRGHVLTIARDDRTDLEVYDVKELNERELLLHYDIGMELRGIARLAFRKTDAGSPRARERDVKESGYVVVATGE